MSNLPISFAFLYYLLTDTQPTGVYFPLSSRDGSLTCIRSTATGRNTWWFTYNVRVDYQQPLVELFPKVQELHNKRKHKKGPNDITVYVNSDGMKRLQTVYESMGKVSIEATGWVLKCTKTSLTYNGVSLLREDLKRTSNGGFDFQGPMAIEKYLRLALTPEEDEETEDDDRWEGEEEDEESESEEEEELEEEEPEPIKRQRFDEKLNPVLLKLIAKNEVISKAVVALSKLKSAEDILEGIQELEQESREVAEAIEALKAVSKVF